MSLAARHRLVSHPNALFRTDRQRQDILDPSITQTDLIAMLLGVHDAGVIFEYTAIKSDHSDDSCLGLHSHADGFCADGWFNSERQLGAYLDANDPRFEHGLAVAAKSIWLYQIGLAGSADTHAAEVAAGRTVFADDGADHCHFGANG